MLTRDLLRYRLDGDQVKPSFLKATPAIRELTEAVLAHWQGGVGGRLGELEDAAIPILHRSRALVVGRGLQKLVLDGCTFGEPPSAATLREAAFAASASSAFSHD